MDAVLYMPSSGRATRCATLGRLPEDLRTRVLVAVPEPEADAYMRALPGQPVLAVPEALHGIAPTRQWLLEHAASQGHKVMLQLSDDMRFVRRISLDDWHLRQAGPEDVAVLLYRLAGRVSSGEYVHAGVHARSGLQNKPAPMMVAQRMCDVYAHHVPTLMRYGIRWDRTPVMEDFDVTLQLLRRGLPNAVDTEFGWDQQSSNAVGGCSQYRTPELQQQGAERLHELHPAFVRVTQKPASNWKGFNGTRYDVTVQWQRALKAADLR